MCGQQYDIAQPVPERGFLFLSVQSGDTPWKEYRSQEKDIKH
jgi:hypothetical protein